MAGLFPETDLVLSRRCAFPKPTKKSPEAKKGKRNPKFQLKTKQKQNNNKKIPAL